jgi:hypothetical protein
VGVSQFLIAKNNWQRDLVAGRGSSRRTSGQMGLVNNSVHKQQILSQYVFQVFAATNAFNIE